MARTLEKIIAKILMVKIRLLFKLLNTNLPKFDDNDLIELIMNEMYDKTQGEYRRNGYTVGEKCEIVYHVFKEPMGWSEKDFHEFKKVL